jgi:carboxymethylenebutenolidase
MTAACEWVDVSDDLRAYYGRPAGDGPHPCVVVYIEAFGVNDHFQRLTQRLADAGLAAITPDIYDGRTYAYEDLDGAIGHLKAMDDDKVMAQTEACLDWFAGRTEVDANRAGVAGFCMGGRYAFLANAQLASRFKGAASFYGGGIGPEEDFVGRKTLLDRVDEIQAPTIFWYGSEDQSIRPAELGRISEALGNANKEFTMTCFPIVGHGFFCEDRGSYNETAAEKAWRQTIDFFDENLV